MAVGTLGSPLTPELHNLPDLVIDKVLRLIPTKAAVTVSFHSKQWQGAVSSCPSLNFDEDDDCDRHNFKRYGHCQHQHIRFINFLKGYLDYLEKNDQKKLLDKLSLHMTMYGHRDSSTITKWLKYACQRGLKELDISPSFHTRQYGLVSLHSVKSGHFYRLPWVAIATAKSLTSLNLERVRVPHVRSEDYPNGVRERFFPFLKTLSFKTARIFTDQALYSVLFHCPSIEYLSLTECEIANSKCYVQCSSLKSLEVKLCRLDYVRVERAFNLESFTFLSLPGSTCEKMILNNAFNLKHINISVDWYLGEFSLLGCHRALEATINTERIQRFEFFDGYLSAKFSFKDDQTTIDRAIILVKELWDQERLSTDSTYVPRLVSFVKSLSCCNDVSLYSKNVEALTVSNNYRKMTSLPPLPKTSILEVRVPNLALFASHRDYYELVKTLRWTAPSARIWINRAHVEEDRKKVEQRASPAGHI